ncbi:gp18 [Escherichia phage phiEB49]|uniref:Gp18 n=1 Tax=Escherichia phage phiEB49 TaxID=1048207 RepID=F8UBS8_9CAUD|nr:gp18 [Escherichia phage phiEB49]AEI91218.1 gp18 [Escherichia phage phiEB49]
MKTYFETKWELFKEMAAQELHKAGYKYDGWDMAWCLDMSFDHDYLNTDIETWRDRMVADIAEMKKDCPEDFL